MLDIENITVAYHGQPFLRDFSLHMKRGEIISLVGESGSGKTTAIRSILGLLPQEGELVSGDILFEGKSLPEYSEKEMQKLRGSRISMIFQDSGAMLNPIRKIGSQYIEYIQKHEKLGHKTAEEKAVAMLEAMRLSEPERIMKSYSFQLSGGMRQRIGIAKDGFYSSMKEAHKYNASDFAYLDTLGYDFDPAAIDCRADADVDPDAPICIGMDYNANINWIVAGQPKRTAAQCHQVLLCQVRA